MLQGNEAEGADTLFEGKGTKNNRDFQISRKIFQSVIGKNSVLLFILSTQFLGNFQRLSDLLHQDFTRRKFRHVLGDLDSRLVELEKFDLFPIYQKTTLSDRTLQLKDLLPEEPLLYATMSIGSQVATQFVLLVFFEQIASFFLYF